MDIGYLAALAGGALALFSPCSALLLPSFFAYAFRTPARLLARTGVFYAGLCAALVPLGMGSALVSTLFYGHREALVTAAGTAVILLGVAQVLAPGSAWGLPARWQARIGGRTGAVSVFGLGAVYGLAGFCSGPVLGAVLTVAATGTVLRGALLLACYALGMAAPMFFLAALWDRCDLGRRRWLRGHLHTVGPLRLHTTGTVSGLLFVGVGVLFVAYDGTAALGGLPGLGWLEEAAYRAQEPLFALDARVDLALLAVVGAVLVGVVLRRVRRDLGGRGRGEGASGGDGR
ncbi:cytochrome c biogenesis protein CcdA [Thermobifida halotolerans]|uniref:Cytochrome c biogenesis protein CcdA n=1 Tax=Thermobifida halotolerans TaxID=483545 RepID=A0A399G7K2_9ACTN|nr:cytochrome c biogenesis CcdA family protein [Thermobifida halotolerans]UOE20975.1 cytochrome c biogenesis protein CcdA [Thermobifida halotolerans]